MKNASGNMATNSKHGALNILIGNVFKIGHHAEPQNTHAVICKKKGPDPKVQPNGEVSAGK